MNCDRKIGPYPCCSVIQGDCLGLLPRLDWVRPHELALVTDPPYGIGEARANNPSRSKLAQSRDYGVSAWDDRPCSPAQIAEMRRVSRWQIIFGGNYFELPPSSCWLVWDKQNGDNDFADCELAWTNLEKAVRRICWQWHGMIRKDNEERFHPTQKPLGVMKWCIEQLPDDDAAILDPYCGSGTTLVAAKKLGRHFLGFEISPEYCEIARKRIALVEAQPNLFQPKAEQLSLTEEPNV